MPPTKALTIYQPPALEIKLAKARERRLARANRERLMARVFDRTLDTAVDMTKLFLSNPVTTLVGSYVLIEYLQKHPRENPIMPDKAGTVLEAAILTTEALNAVAKSGIITQMVDAGSKAASSATGIVKDVLPLLALAGGA